MSMDIPENPNKQPEKVARPPREETEKEILRDIRELLDYHRRNFEQKVGGIQQEDASEQDSIDVAAGDTETIILEVEKGKNFLLEQVGVQPRSGNIEIKVDQEDWTTNIKHFPKEFRVQNRIEIEINNTSANEKTYDYFIDARKVSIRD
jgi:hypothetical protein